MQTLKFVSMPVSGNGGTETVLNKVLLHLADHYQIKLYLTNHPENRHWLEPLEQHANIAVTECSSNKLAKLVYLSKIFWNSQPNDHFIILGANIIPLAQMIRDKFGRDYQITSWIHYSLANQSLFDPRNLLDADDHWAISQSIADQLIQLGADPTSVRVINNPIERYTGQKNQPSKHPAQPQLVYVGRLELNGQKNLTALFKGIQQCKQAGISPRVALYGQYDQTTADKFAAAADQAGVTDNIDVKGWTADPWTDVISNVHPDALVLSSTFEGLPMVMLEAMSRGIPCLVTKFSGYDSILQEGVNGYSYDGADSLNFAAALMQLMSSDWDASAVQQSINKFYFDHYFQTLETVLKA